LALLRRLLVVRVDAVVMQASEKPSQVRTINGVQFEVGFTPIERNRSRVACGNAPAALRQGAGAVNGM